MPMFIEVRQVKGQMAKVKGEVVLRLCLLTFAL